METSPLNDFAWEQYLNEGKLMGSKCGECGQVFVPPRALCTKCYSNNMEWHETSGMGKLSAFTCISVGPPSMVSEGYDRNNPYCCGVVELEEGVRMTSNIVDCGTGDVYIGMPVEAVFEQVTATQTLVKFCPAH